MADTQDVNTLQRRGRRRLVGAIALVLLAVIVLPMVFDPEPKPSAPPVSVRIPGEDETKFVPRAASKGPLALLPDAAEKKSAEKPLAAKLAEPPGPVAPPAGQSAAETPGAKAPDKPASRATGKTTAKAAEEPVAKAPAAAESARADAVPQREQFFVQVGAFASAEKVKETGDRLKVAKLPYYTESVATAMGPVTRVRAGPFADRAAAERVRKKLIDLGLKPGSVAPKP